MSEQEKSNANGLRKVGDELVRLGKGIKKDFSELPEKLRGSPGPTAGGDSSETIKIGDETVSVSALMVPRERPKKTRTYKQEPGDVRFAFKARHAIWGRFGGLIMAMLVFLLIAELVMLVPMSFSRLSSSQQDFYGFLWIVCLLTVGLIFLAHKISFPYVKVMATNEAIKFGNMLLSRKHYGGVRIGYTEQEDVKLQRVRVVYGQWGEDTPYQLEPYNAVMILAWINQMIDSAKVKKARKGAQSGTREQAFE